MKPFSCRALRSKIEMKQRREAASRDLLWAKILSKRMSRKIVKSASGHYLGPLRLLLSTCVSKFICKRRYKKCYNPRNARKDAYGAHESVAPSLSIHGAENKLNAVIYKHKNKLDAYSAHFWKTKETKAGLFFKNIDPPAQGGGTRQLGARVDRAESR